MPQAVIDSINEALGALRATLESGTAEEIKAKVSELQKVLMKIGESLAGQSGGASGGEQPGGGASSGGGSTGSGTYDADVKDEKK